MMLSSHLGCPLSPKTLNMGNPGSNCVTAVSTGRKCMTSRQVRNGNRILRMHIDKNDPKYRDSAAEILRLLIRSVIAKVNSGERRRASAWLAYRISFGERIPQVTGGTSMYRKLMQLGIPIIGAVVTACAPVAISDTPTPTLIWTTPTSEPLETATPSATPMATLTPTPTTIPTASLVLPRDALNNRLQAGPS